MSQPPHQPESSTPSFADTRRDFLRASGTALATAALASQTAGATGGFEPFGEREIKIGLVGCGGRGTGAVSQLLNSKTNIKLVAMADAFENRLATSLKQLERHAKRLGDSGLIDVPESRQHTGLDAYQKVIDSDCDLVVLATPPGFRPEQFAAAIDAGKHVFMEKPVAVDAPGIRQVIATGKKAAEQGLAVQVGLQRRHELRYQQIIERLQDGAIGDLLLSRVYWNSAGVWVRPRTPEQSELQYQVNNWYYFNWTCGEQIVEQHIHNLDVANWANNATPIDAQGQGGREVRDGKDHGQIFDHMMIEYTYPSGGKLLSCCRHVPGAWPQVAEFFLGSKGSARIVGRGTEIYDREGSLIWKYEGPKLLGHQQEQTNLVAALRAGKAPNETEYGALSTMTAILGRMAAHSGKMLTWEEAFNSDLSLAPAGLTWDSAPPVTPDDEGRYPVPTPGKTQVV